MLLLEGNKPAEIRGYLHQLGVSTDMPDPEGSTGQVFFPVGRGAPIVWVQSRQDIKTLTHELLHVTFQLLRLRGVRESPESEETYTYTLEYLLDQAMCAKGWRKLKVSACTKY